MKMLEGGTNKATGIPWEYRDKGFFVLCVRGPGLRNAEFIAGVLAKTLGRNSTSLPWNLKQLQMAFSPMASAHCHFQITQVQPAFKSWGERHQ